MTTNHPGPFGEMDGSESTEVGSSCPRQIPRRMRQTVSAYPQTSSAPYVLIISSDEALADTLLSILDESGLAAEHATSMTDGCALAESGHFHVVLTEPSLNDGSWRRLASLARRKHLALVIVLIAKSFDLRQWFYAKQAGVFDVIDTLSELPKAGEVVMRALWVEYLKGVGPVPESLRLRGKGGGNQ
jgi:hypothetical protein